MDYNNTNDENTIDKICKATESTTGNRRKATEETTGNRRKATEETTGNRRKATEETTGNRRKATEETTGNRRKATEETTGNRRKATEESTGGRRIIEDAPAENVYTKAWDEAENGSFTEVQQYLMTHINSARYDDIDSFKKAAKGVSFLQALSGKTYQVKDVLDDQGGESLVLLCQGQDGKRHVAKIYYELERRDVKSRRDFLQLIKVRTKIIEFSRKEESAPYVLPVEDIGTVSLQPGTGNYFEIQPYCEEGDLSLKPPMTVEELLPFIRQMNEAIHYIHESGLLHMDIKPENMYLHEGRVVIGDFGIAHIIENNVRKTEHAGGTDGYRAPETLFIPNVNNVAFVLTPGVDYYSLGVTIASLFKGAFIFEGIENEMATIMLNSFIPLADKGDPKQEMLQNLINGLCQYDVKVRFGYEDILSWMENPYYKVASGKEGWTKNYTFHGQVCHDALELYEAFSGDWEGAKKHLYRGLVKDFFASMDPDLSNRAIEIVEEECPAMMYEGSEDVGLFKFLKYLHPMGQINWKGHTFGSLFELGEKMRITKTPAGYGDMLKKQIVSTWISGIVEDSHTTALVHEIEELAVKDPELACRWFGYAFSKTKEVEFLGQVITSPEDMVACALQSIEGFYDYNGPIEIITNNEKNDALFGFLYSEGFRSILDSLFVLQNIDGDYEKAQAVLLLFDEIAIRKESLELASIVRPFCKYYGPNGYIPYLQELLKTGKVYETSNPEDTALMKRIEDTVISETYSVEAQMKLCLSLLADIDKMRLHTQNNPFKTELGMMEKKTIECYNVAGLFLYEFLGHMVPVGYASKIREGGEV